MDIEGLISGQYLILIPFLYVIGIFIKTTPLAENKYIPICLGTLGIVFGFLIAYFDSTKDNSNFMVMFNGAIQGLFAAGIAVFGNQLIKQISDLKGVENKDED